MAELLRTSLAKLGFRIEFVNDELQEMSAQLNKTERGTAGNWSYEYQAMATWSEAEEGTTLEVEISELKNTWTQPNCNALCNDLLEGVMQRAAKVSQLAKTKSNRYGSAKWATHEDLVEADYWNHQTDSRRLLISPGEDGNCVTITPEDTVKHALVCGPTGCGKTSSIFVPNLLGRIETSAIVTEATAGTEPPDLYGKTSGYRHLVGRQQVYYFNPDDLRSDRINPLDAVHTYAQAQSMAQLIVDNTTSKNNYGDDVWPKSEVNLLTIFIAHVAANGGHIGQIRAMMREGPDKLVPIMEQSPVESVRNEYRGFANNSREGFRYGVFAGLMQRLALWVNPRIVALTEKTDIDAEVLAEQLFTFYLAVPAQKNHLKPVAALMFNFILEIALEQEFRHPLYLSLDEFTNFGMIPGLADKLSIIRHRDIAVMLGFQDFSQLERVYGREETTSIRSQMKTQIYFRPNMLESAKRISEHAGRTTEYERKISSSGQIVEREMGRDLIDPSEVLNLPEDKILVFTPKTSPMLMERFSWKDYEEISGISSVQKPLIYVDERLIATCDEVKQKPVWQREADKRPEAESTESDRSRAPEIRPEEVDIDLESGADSVTKPAENEQDSDTNEDITFV